MARVDSVKRDIWCFHKAVYHTLSKHSPILTRKLEDWAEEYQLKMQHCIYKIYIQSYKLCKYPLNPDEELSIVVFK